MKLEDCVRDAALTTLGVRILFEHLISSSVQLSFWQSDIDSDELDLRVLISDLVAVSQSIHETPESRYPQN